MTGVKFYGIRKYFIILKKYGKIVVYTYIFQITELDVLHLFL